MLAGGNDFYSNPRLSQDGAKLAWVTWNHPNMPWDDTELWVADISADGSLSGQRKVLVLPRSFCNNFGAFCRSFRAGVPKKKLDGR